MLLKEFNFMKNFKYILLLIVLSLLMSIDSDYKNFYSINKFFVLVFVNFLYLKDIINYFYGRDFWSLGVKPKSNDNRLYRLYWFLLLIFVYFLTLYAVTVMI